MKAGVDLNLPPKIIIDTIHQVKGGEADNVVLASKCNFPSHYDKKNLADKVKELRVWYTGVTRSKKHTSSVRYLSSIQLSTWKVF